MERMRARSRRGRWLVTALVSTILTLTATAPLYAPTAKGKLSKNFFRIPYADGVDTRMLQDYIDHGNTPAGNTGPMDMRSQTATLTIVAAADGRVTAFDDSGNDCGCHASFGSCGNFIQIDHANGEISQYVHVQQNSVSGFAGLSVGDCVNAGDIIGLEGDVGYTCSSSGSERSPTVGTCLGSVPSPLQNTNCFRHLHWQVIDVAMDEFVNPMTCGISGNVYQDNANYTAGDCTQAGCPADRDLGPLAYAGLGTFAVFQADNSITADDVQISNSASVVFHAGNEVRLTPGFIVTAGGHFRAEIGPCNTTSNAGCPPP